MSFSDSEEQDEIIDVSAENRTQHIKKHLKNVCQSIKLSVDTLIEFTQCCLFLLSNEKSTEIKFGIYLMETFRDLNQKCCQAL